MGIYSVNKLIVETRRIAKFKLISEQLWTEQDGDEQDGIWSNEVI